MKNWGLDVFISYVRAVYSAAGQYCHWYGDTRYQDTVCAINCDIYTVFDICIEMYACVCACLSAPAFWLLVGRRWGRVRGLTAVTKQKTCRAGQAVLHLYGSAGSESISLFLIISCKLIVDTVKWTKNQETDVLHHLCTFANVMTDFLSPVLFLCYLPCEAQISRLPAFDATRLPPNTATLTSVL